jgi:pre-mRNA-splicing factor SPF27
MSLDTVHDSLPYYDPPLTAEAREAIDKLIEQEQIAVPYKDDIQLSDSLKSHIERIEKKQGLNAINLSRYSLDTPSPSSINNAIISMEYQNTKRENLDLLSQYGSNSWLVHNAQLEYLLSRYELELEREKTSRTRLAKRFPGWRTNGGV